MYAEYLLEKLNNKLLERLRVVRLSYWCSFKYRSHKHKLDKTLFQFALIQVPLNELGNLELGLAKANESNIWLW